MSEFFTEYGIFLAKSITVLLVVLAVLSAIGAAARQRRSETGRIEARRVNDVLDDMRDALRREAIDPKKLKKLRKREEKARKQHRGDEDRRRVWVLNFEGDLQASAAEHLRREVTAVLTLAEEGDEVVACIESPGGMVHSYGFAASQLHRIREREGLRLTAAIDRVAASGGYLMACLGERIIAAPFALVGSIGVMAQVPNFHRLLKRHDIDVEVLTAGEYKRTLTLLGENTEKGRQKFLEELEDVHGLFKDYVAAQRPGLDVERVATGEAWYGSRAVELGLIDELMTSDEYLARACREADVYEVRWLEHKNPMERVLQQGTAQLAAAAERLLARWRDRHSWTG